MKTKLLFASILLFVTSLYASRMAERLRAASASGDIGQVSALIKQGINAVACDESGRIAAHYAAANGHTELTLYLLGVDGTNGHQIDSNLYRDIYGLTPRDYAIINNHIETALDLIRVDTNPDAAARATLVAAVRFGRTEIIRQLRAMTADSENVFSLSMPVEVNELGFPWLVAAQTVPAIAIMSGNPAVVEYAMPPVTSLYESVLSGPWLARELGWRDVLPLFNESDFSEPLVYLRRHSDVYSAEEALIGAANLLTSLTNRRSSAIEDNDMLLRRLRRRAFDYRVSLEQNSDALEQEIVVDSPIRLALVRLLQIAALYDGETSPWYYTSALIMAAYNWRDVALAQSLLHRGPQPQLERRYEQYVASMIDNSNTASLREILNREENLWASRHTWQGVFPLARAIQLGRAEEALTLVDYFADLGIRNFNGQYWALHRAFDRGATLLHLMAEAPSNRYLSYFSHILENGLGAGSSVVNNVISQRSIALILRATDTHGRRILDYARDAGNLEIAGLFSLFERPVVSVMVQLPRQESFIENWLRGIRLYHSVTSMGSL